MECLLRVFANDCSILKSIYFGVRFRQALGFDKNHLIERWHFPVSNLQIVRFLQIVKLEYFPFHEAVNSNLTELILNKVAEAIGSNLIQ